MKHARTLSALNTLVAATCAAVGFGAIQGCLLVPADDCGNDPYCSAPRSPVDHDYDGRGGCDGGADTRGGASGGTSAGRGGTAGHGTAGAGGRGTAVDGNKNFLVHGKTPMG